MVTFGQRFDPGGNHGGLPTGIIFDDLEFLLKSGLLHLIDRFVTPVEHKVVNPGTIAHGGLPVSAAFPSTIQAPLSV